MSRASTLRDAVAQVISNALPTVIVQTCVVANYRPEDLDQPIVAVQIDQRTITVDMGPSSRLLDIQVSILGRSPSQTGYPTDAKSAYREAEVAACDIYDQLAEDVIGLWTPATPLSQSVLAEHRLTSLTQEVSFDVPSYYENGIWFTTIRLQFYDYHDED